MIYNFYYLNKKFCQKLKIYSKPKDKDVNCVNAEK